MRASWPCWIPLRAHVTDFQKFSKLSDTFQNRDHNEAQLGRFSHQNKKWTHLLNSTWICVSRGACSAANDVPSPNKGRTWAASVPWCQSCTAHTERRHGGQKQIVEAILFLLAWHQFFGTCSCTIPTCDLKKLEQQHEPLWSRPGRILCQATFRVAPGGLV